MIRGSDYDSVNILTGKKIVVVNIHCRGAILHSLALIMLFDIVPEAVTFDVIDITTCNHLHILHFDETAEEIIGLLAQSDETEPDLVVGRCLFPRF